MQGNLIGTNEAGFTALANGGDGIDAVGTGVTVGGTTEFAGNTISGNLGDGIEIGDADALIEGNFIGTNVVGDGAIPNSGDGVLISAAGATIGGTVAGAGNVISGNEADGIDVNTAGCLIAGNWIGSDAVGTTAVPNQQNGVFLSQGTTGGQTVGLSGNGNIIAFNDEAGVAISSGTTGSTIRFNSIFENTGPGIDLNDDGVTPNTPGVATNAPVITAATAGLATGTLNASPDSTYTIDFYANPSGDASAARPQGRTYLGSTTVATNSQGNASFYFAYTSVAGEPFLTATSTGSTGTTSEFSTHGGEFDHHRGETFSATEGLLFDATVAGFSSTDALATAADFAATITWGDGSSSAGTVVALGAGYIVVGSHTYSQANPAFPVSVAITDTLDSSQATAHGVADVTGPSGADDVSAHRGLHDKPTQHGDGRRIHRLECGRLSWAVHSQHQLGRQHSPIRWSGHDRRRRL